MFGFFFIEMNIFTILEATIEFFMTFWFINQKNKFSQFNLELRPFFIFIQLNVYPNVFVYWLLIFLPNLVDI